MVSQERLAYNTSIISAIFERRDIRMPETPRKQRRRFPRFKITPVFRLKARVRAIGEKQTHYFDVINLSMGGALLISHKGVNFDANVSNVLEILFFSGDLSLRCVARIAQGTFVEKNEEDDDLDPQCVQLGIEIVGIDEKSRKHLGDFLYKLDHQENEVPSAASP